MALPIIAASGASVALASTATQHSHQVYRVENREGVWWYVSPEGRPLFSRGVCCVDMGTPARDYSPERPSYCAARHYAGDVAWAKATTERLRRWGFTTIGGWSDYRGFCKASEQGLPISPVLHAGSTAGIPWLDMWDPVVLARVDGTASSGITVIGDAAKVLGYYSDNELGWWNATLVKMTLEMPPESRQRRRVVAFLRRLYGDRWDRLLRDFDPEGATSFEDFDRRGALFVRPGGNGARVERRILGLLAERYYRVTTAAVRKHRRALVLGDRFQSFYYPEVVRAARRYVDVISTNLNAHWIDGSFARYYLRTLHELAGKPVQIGEFYMCASDNRSGNPNSSAGFPVVRTQAERAAGFRRTVEQAASLPYVIGIDWFQYYDEPPHGRADGEDYNMGLVDIDDAPYDEITTAASRLDAHSLHMTAADRGRASRGVPKAQSDPLRNFTAMRALAEWDRESGYVEPSTRYAMADLYACWTDDALYLGVHATGFLEAAAYREGIVPECDRSVLTIKVGRSPREVRVRFGSGRAPVSSHNDVQALDSDAAKDDVRSVVAVVLPAKCLGVASLSSGMSLPIDVRLDTAGRCDHVRWKRSLVLR